MHLIIATEIWGNTPDIQLLARRFCACNMGVTVVDPYDGSDRKFVCEEDAYAAYRDECGHDEYCRRVWQALEDKTDPVWLLGFSAGAGAVWAAACRKDARNLKQAFCFYGSSIRNMRDDVPHVPVEMIFPAYEKHFDVHSLVETLRNKEMVRCHVVPYGHGFMNSLSESYDAEGCDLWRQWLVRCLTESSDPFDLNAPEPLVL